MKNPTQEVAAQRNESRAQMTPVQVRLDAIFHLTGQGGPEVTVPGPEEGGKAVKPLGNPLWCDGRAATNRTDLLSYWTSTSHSLQEGCWSLEKP